MSKEGWSIVHAHLLVVKGKAEQHAAPAIMPCSNGSGRTCLSTKHAVTIATGKQQ